VQDNFRLSAGDLQDLCRQAAGHYAGLEEGVWSLYCDGASRGNPGLARAGVVLIDPNGEVHEELREFLRQATNNLASYRGLLLGLKQAWDLGIKKILVTAASPPQVRQINGSHRLKQAHLLVLWQAAHRELQKFMASELTQVPPELNRQAGRRANEAIDQRPRSR
jgi:ribonuclease HI